ncbi:MAG: hypothetical protein H6618_09890 [Deltaproteobacteria bacterium]|nr:hypothetical protein [Deltaproteobacteria bacterium]
MIDGKPLASEMPLPELSSLARGKSAQTRSIEPVKGPSFKETLQSAAEQQKTKRHEPDQNKKPETRPSLLRAQSKSKNFRRNKSEDFSSHKTEKQQTERTERGQSQAPLRKWGQKLRKKMTDSGEYPELALLTGTLNPELRPLIPDIIAQSPFISRALNSDLKNTLNQPIPLHELADSLGLGDSLKGSGISAEINPGTQISPADFFREIGIAPSTILSELNSLKKGLPETSENQIMNLNQTQLIPDNGRAEQNNPEHMRAAPPEPTAVPDQILSQTDLSSGTHEKTKGQPEEKNNFSSARNHFSDEEMHINAKNNIFSSITKEKPGQEYSEIKPQPDPSITSANKVGGDPRQSDFLPKIDPPFAFKNQTHPELPEISRSPYQYQNVNTKPTNTEPLMPEPSFPTLQEIKQSPLNHTKYDLTGPTRQAATTATSDNIIRKLTSDIGPYQYGNTIPSVMNTQDKNHERSLLPSSQDNDTMETLQQPDILTMSQTTNNGNKQFLKDLSTPAIHSKLTEAQWLNPEKFHLSSQLSQSKGLSEEERQNPSEKVILSEIKDHPSSDITGPTQATRSISPTEKTDPGSHVAKADQSNINHQIRSKVLLLNGQGGGIARIDFPDHEKGQASISVQVEGKDVTLTMLNSDKSLHQFLGDHLAALRESLATQQLTLNDTHPESSRQEHPKDMWQQNHTDQQPGQQPGQQQQEHASTLKQALWASSLNQEHRSQGTAHNRNQNTNNLSQIQIRV